LGFAIRQLLTPPEKPRREIGFHAFPKDAANRAKQNANETHHQLSTINSQPSTCCHPAGKWIERFEEWLADSGFLKKQRRQRWKRFGNWDNINAQGRRVTTVEEKLSFDMRTVVVFHSTWRCEERAILGRCPIILNPDGLNPFARNEDATPSRLK
jgi:hypothetical protein